MKNIKNFVKDAPKRLEKLTNNYASVITQNTKSCFSLQYKAVPL